MKIECKICCHQYDDKERLPMALPCGHILCGVCTANMPRCPWDQTRFRQKKLVKSYPMMEIIEEINQDYKTENDVFDFCKVHKKKLKYVCLKDEQLICRLCVVECHGDHPIENIRKLEQEMKHILLNINDFYKLACKQTHKSFLTSQQDKQLLMAFNAKHEIKQTLKSRVQTVVAVIHKMERQLASQIEEVFEIYNNFVVETNREKFESLNNSNNDLYEDLKKNLDQISALGSQKVSETSVPIMQAHRELMKKVTALQKGLGQTEKDASMFASIKAVLEKNVLSALNLIPMLNEELMADIFLDANLDYYLSCKSKKSKTSRLSLRDYSNTLSANDVELLARSCGSRDDHSISALWAPSFYGEFEIKFKKKAARRRLEYLDGLSLPGGQMKVDRVGPLEESSHCLDKNARSPYTATKELTTVLREVHRFLNDFMSEFHMRSLAPGRFFFDSLLFLDNVVKSTLDSFACISSGL